MEFILEFRKLLPNEAKDLYRKLAKKNHPDFGGDLVMMQKLNSAYADYMRWYSNNDARERGNEAHANNKKSAVDYCNIDEVSDEIGKVVKDLLEHCWELDVELCGLWIWVTGDTKPMREYLRENGFRWSAQKVAWYKPFVKSYSRGNYTLDEIRTTYGSKRFRKDGKVDLVMIEG